jgi:ABC-type glycerol-3-phosphate transport system permease component
MDAQPAVQTRNLTAKGREAPGATPSPGVASWFGRRGVRLLGKVLLLLVVAIGAVFFVIPFAWMVSTAGKSGELVWVIPPVWIPPAYEWRNYIDSWSLLPFKTYYLNTLKITSLTVAGVLFSSTLAAFAFARLRFPGRGILFVIVLSTMMLPWHVTIIPQYILYAKLHWVNTHKALWVQWWFGDAFSIFLLRQFFMTIPLELDDAARIDGASRLGTLWHILLPLSKPALAVVAIFEFTWSWNNFMGPLIYLDSQKLFPVALGLRLFQDRSGTNIQFMMAQTVIFVIPVMILFFVSQRRFIQGIVVSGVKG